MCGHDDLRSDAARGCLAEPADEANHLLEPLGVNALFGLLDEQHFRGIGRMDEGKQAEE